MLFVRRPATRPLLRTWIAGQAVATAIYLGLYFLVVRVVAAGYDTMSLISTFLQGAFPKAGENWLAFFAIGVLKQFAYVASSWAGGGVALLLAALGLAVWLRKGDQRTVLVASLYLAVIGAVSMFFPFGRTRHTVLIGLVSLAAVGAGLDALGRWRAVGGLLGVLAFLAPTSDLHNLPIGEWQKSRWERALRQMDAAIPAGERLMVDKETDLMLRARLWTEQDRGVNTPVIKYKGNPILATHDFDWAATPTATIREAAGRAEWLADAGFNTGNLKARREELGLTTVIDEPGVLYLGRLR
jgi:hypothetical protein